MKEFTVILKLSVSGPTRQQAVARVAALVDQLDATDDPFLSVVDAWTEEPVHIRKARKV